MGLRRCSAYSEAKPIDTDTSVRDSTRWLQPSVRKRARCRRSLAKQVRPDLSRTPYGLSLVKTVVPYASGLAEVWYVVGVGRSWPSPPSGLALKEPVDWKLRQLIPYGERVAELVEPLKCRNDWKLMTVNRRGTLPILGEAQASSWMTLSHGEGISVR